MLGLVSMCMDLSSELVHSLLPLYMATALGASVFVIGMIEGVAEALALIIKLFSGALSDLFRKRKPLVLLGYGIAAVSKFAFPLAPTLGWIVGARLADRVGKGIRGAPRDALIADITPAAFARTQLRPAPGAGYRRRRRRPVAGAGVRWRISRAISTRHSGSPSCRRCCASR